MTTPKVWRKFLFQIQRRKQTERRVEADMTGQLSQTMRGQKGKESKRGAIDKERPLGQKVKRATQPK